MGNHSQSSFSPRIGTARFIAAGFGSGWVPKLPGTAGSAAICVIWYLLIPPSTWAIPCAGFAIVCAVSVLGAWAIKAAVGSEADEDPSWIVIDEWAGMLVALLPLHDRSIFLCLIAFALFRLFDIVKPWPISRAERLPGAAGVLLDDLIAGVFAALCLYGLLLVFF